MDVPPESDSSQHSSDSDSDSPFPSPPSTSQLPFSRASSHPLLLSAGRVRQASVDSSGGRGRAKSWVCDYPGCGKAYTRPVRLEEHQRSHTGERPFICAVCSASFTRDSHLKAHERTHQADSDKPFGCDECGKRFWTNQHLKKHVEVIHRGKTYNCDECESSFRKHHQLRTHIAEAHSPPGTNPFQCEHPGCGKSFKQSVHLKAHAKTHDPARYQCAHPACLLLPPAERQFPNWTALQRHTKQQHPPTCPHAECNSKTFTSGRGLKQHLALHEEKAAQPGPADETDAGYTTDGAKGKSKKRRGRGRARKRAAAAEVSASEGEGEVNGARPSKKARLAAVPAVLPWKCSAQVGCTKAFDSRELLLKHIQRQHSKKLEPALGPTSLEEFMASTLPSALDTDADPPSAPQMTSQLVAISSDCEQPSSQPSQFSQWGTNSLLGLLTGHDYAGDKGELRRKYGCPFPAIVEIAEPAAQSESECESEQLDNLGRDCEWRFTRVYDVERHLKSKHGCRVEQSKLEDWLEEQAREEERAGAQPAAGRG